MRLKRATDCKQRARTSKVTNRATREFRKKFIRNLQRRVRVSGGEQTVDFGGWEFSRRHAMRVYSTTPPASSDGVERCDQQSNSMSNAKAYPNTVNPVQTGDWNPR
jgi:hypothetical protein